MIIAKTIKNPKRNRFYCKWVEHKDKKMIKKVLKMRLKQAKEMIRIIESIDIYAGYGLLSVEEGLELHRNIKKAIEIVNVKNAKDAAERMAELSIRRIAHMVGGEVVEEVTE